MVVLLRLSVTRFVTAYGVSCHIGQEQARLSYPGGTHSRCDRMQPSRPLCWEGLPHN